MNYRSDIDITECPEVYPPAEDTFLMLECLEVASGERALEMGCGTGLITCHLAAAGAEVTAADVNPRAVECTRRNLERNGLKAEVVLTDLFRDLPGRFDTIVFNPPYCAGEEDDLLALSWAGGPDGVVVTERFLAQAVEHLKEGGRIILLLSTEMEAEGLDRCLSAFEQRTLGSTNLFFERLWVVELRPEKRGSGQKRKD